MKLNKKLNFTRVICSEANSCTTSKVECNTCSRNKLAKISDKFSNEPGGYKPVDKWLNGESDDKNHAF